MKHLLVSVRSKELWLVQENHATIKLDSNGLSVNESRIKLRYSQILKKMLEKSKQFLSSEQPCEPKSLVCCLEYCRSWKNKLGKHAIVVNTESGNVCPLWLVIFKSVPHSIGGKLRLRYSWPWAVVSYTLLAVVPWNGLEHIRVGKQGYVLKWSFDDYVRSFLTLVYK